MSYAHGGPDSDQAAHTFFKELSSDLQTLVSVPVGTDMGFLDVIGLRPAVRWRFELATALGHCQVLVALISAPYLQREWCGKEWHAFTLREREPRPKTSLPPNQGAIIPVRWAPIPFSMPQLVQNELQIFKPESTKEHPDLPQQYAKEGLFGLLRRDQKSAFDNAVWDLAMSVQRIYYSQHLKPMKINPEDLRNAFEEGTS